MALMEVQKCSDVKCKYITESLICPEDWFDDEKVAECSHPLSPQPNILGTDDEDKYLDIPEWCPLRKG